MFNFSMAILLLIAFYFSAKEIVGSWFSLFNPQALLLVVIGVLFLSTFIVGKSFFKNLFQKDGSIFRKQNLLFTPELLESIVKLADERYSEAAFKRTTYMNVKDFFLRLCLDQQLENTLGPESVGRVYLALAQQRLENFYDIAYKLKTLAQYAPGVGVFGSLLALIGYSSHLDNTIASKGIGELLIICLYSVMYGYFIANFLLAPLAENIIQKAEKDFKKNEIIAQGLYLLFSNVNPKSIEAELSSFIEVDFSSKNIKVNA